MISVYTKLRTRSCVNCINVDVIMITSDPNDSSYNLRFINNKSFEIRLKSASRKALENVMNDVCCGKYCSRHGMVDLDQLIRYQSDLAIITIL